MAEVREVRVRRAIGYGGDRSSSSSTIAISRRTAPRRKPRWRRHEAPPCRPTPVAMPPTPARAGEGALRTNPAAARSELGDAGRSSIARQPNCASPRAAARSAAARSAEAAASVTAAEAAARAAEAAASYSIVAAPFDGLVTSTARRAGQHGVARTPSAHHRGDRRFPARVSGRRGARPLTAAGRHGRCGARGRRGRPDDERPHRGSGPCHRSGVACVHRESGVAVGAGDPIRHVCPRASPGRMSATPWSCLRPLSCAAGSCRSSMCWTRGMRGCGRSRRERPPATRWKYSPAWRPARSS